MSRDITAEYFNTIADAAEKHNTLTVSQLVDAHELFAVRNQVILETTKFDIIYRPGESASRSVKNMITKFMSIKVDDQIVTMVKTPGDYKAKMPGMLVARADESVSKEEYEQVLENNGLLHDEGNPIELRKITFDGRFPTEFVHEYFDNFKRSILMYKDPAAIIEIRMHALDYSAF